MGGDSLTAVNLVSLFRDKFNKEIPLQALFNSPNLATLAQLLTSSSDNDDQLDLISSTSNGRHAASDDLNNKDILKLGDAARLHDDELDEEEKEEVNEPQGKEKTVQSEHEFYKDEAEVFLTGVTGFLGVQLLREILRQSKAPKVHLLVRAADEEEGIKRVLETAATYPDEADPLADDAQRKRLKVWPGDLAKPSFGMSDQSFNTLARAV